MPWKAADVEKCPLCDKAVYANEAKLEAGKKWHQMCFKCKTCNKMLESTTVTQHDGVLYCKTCHGKHLGTSGYGYGQGAGILATGSVAKLQGSPAWKAASSPSGPSVEGGCPRCGKRVYDAEKKLGAGGSWHRGCFTCKSCNKSLDSTTLTEKELEIYCKVCYGKLFGPKGLGFGIGAGTLTTT